MTVHLLHTPERVAEMLSVSLSTLENWRANKKGPKFVRLNGERSIRYPDDYLSKWQQEDFDRSMI